MNKTSHILSKTSIFLFLTCYFNIVIGATADEIVFETTQEVLNRLEVDKDRLKKEPEYIQVIVRELIVPHIDFTTMSELALGKNWPMLDDTDQTCFVRSFKNLLVERYAFVLLSYRKQDISYQSAKPIGEKGNVSIIQTLTQLGVKPLTIEYPMRPDTDSWKVIDLVIDNVSLIRNYRKMFNKEIKHKGLEGFINSFDECAAS